MNKNTNIPSLRFPEFSGEWEKKSLGEYIELFSGIALKGEEITEESNGVPILRGINITEGHIRHSKEIDRYYVGNDLSKYKRYLLKENDLVLGMDGSKVGKNVALIKKKDIDSILIQRVACIRAKPIANINYIYLNIFSKKFHDYVDVVNNSSGIPHISSQQIKDFEVGFPTLPEQTKIATFLTAVDEKIQSLKKKKGLLEEYKKGVMQGLFSAGAAGGDKSAMQGHSSLRFKDKDGAAFPDWEMKRLGEITYKTDKKNKNREILPVYSISNVNGFVPQSEQFDGMDSVERGYDTSLYKIVENDTFAYNPARINVGSIGYSGSVGRVIVSSLYVCFKTIENVNDDFFTHFINTNHFKDSVLRNGEGGVRIYLFYENFAEISINLPCLAEQTAIANFLSALDEKIGHVQKQIEKTETWKKGLLQRMFV